MHVVCKGESVVTKAGVIDAGKSVDDLIDKKNIPALIKAGIIEDVKEKKADDSGSDADIKKAEKALEKVEKSIEALKKIDEPNEAQLKKLEELEAKKVELEKVIGEK